MGQWVVMFVDMQDSTGIKHRVKDDAVVRQITRLYTVISEAAEGCQKIKFTGDGAMVAYKFHSQNASQIARQAVHDAVRIVRNIDHLNYRSDCPPIHIRIGIASGECQEFTTRAADLIGKRVDLAARLCSEALPDAILSDEVTLTNAEFVLPD